MKSTYDNRRRALGVALALIHEGGVVDPAAILPAEDGEARELIEYLMSGGWYLIHADDLPAGYVSGNKVRADW